MSRIAYVNGSYVRHALATIHVEDRGNQFADAVAQCAADIEAGGTKLKYFTMIEVVEDLETLRQALNVDRFNLLSESYGTRYQGYDEVKSRFIAVWSELPDVGFKNSRHFVDGNRGLLGVDVCGNQAGRCFGPRVKVDGYYDEKFVPCSINANYSLRAGSALCARHKQ